MSFQTPHARENTNCWSSPEDQHLALTTPPETCNEDNIHNDIESPVSKTLLNAFLKVCETEIKMDQLLKQEQSESHHRDDDDNMSTELRMLTSSEAKLRLDLENIDASAFLPQLCDTSDGSCSSQDDCDNTYQGHACIVSNHNLPLHEYIQRNNETSELSVCKCDETLSTRTATTMSSKDTDTEISEFSETYECGKFVDISIPQGCTKETRTTTKDDKDVLQVMSSYLFGVHDYKVKPLWIFKNSSTDDEHTRSYQGTVCVFVSTCMAISDLQKHVTMLPQQFYLSILVSLLITYIQSKIPHTIGEVQLAASILCSHMLLQTYIK